MSGLARKLSRRARRDCNHGPELKRLRELERAVLAYNDAPPGSIAESDARDGMHKSILAARAAKVEKERG